MFPGNAIDNRMTDKGLRFTDGVKGKLDKISYNLLMMKDKDLVMKLVSAHGGLVENPEQNKTFRWFNDVTRNDGTTLKYFKYLKPFANHYAHRHCVDVHNNLRHYIRSI